MTDPPPGYLPRVGLCSVCLHARVTGNQRGSTFYLCTRSRNDPTFRKYPGLPVLACRGFEPQPLPDPPPSSQQENP